MISEWKEESKNFRIRFLTTSTRFIFNNRWHPHAKCTLSNPTCLCLYKQPLLVSECDHKVRAHSCCFHDTVILRRHRQNEPLWGFWNIVVGHGDYAYKGNWTRWLHTPEMSAKTGHCLYSYLYSYKQPLSVGVHASWLRTCRWRFFFFTQFILRWRTIYYRVIPTHTMYFYPNQGRWDLTGI